MGVSLGIGVQLTLPLVEISAKQPLFLKAGRKSDVVEIFPQLSAKTLTFGLCEIRKEALHKYKMYDEKQASYHSNSPSDCSDAKIPTVEFIDLTSEVLGRNHKCFLGQPTGSVR